MSAAVREGSDMAVTNLVLVHGGKHDSRYWQPTIEALGRQAPHVSVLAVDLPGRRGVPGDMTIAGCVDAVVKQIDDAGMDTLVLAGHSLAGVTMPGIATALGAERVSRIIAVSCCVPPAGRTVADTVSLPTRLVARLLEKTRMPRFLARRIFCNGMTASQTAFSLEVLVPDAPDTPELTRAPVDRSALPRGIPRTWVLTLRDRTVTPKVQLRFAANLGVDEIVPIDTGHNPMVGDPDALAAIFVARL